MSEKSIPDWIMRRARFICAEAQCQDNHYDPSVTHTLRVLSNMATIGSGGVSRAVKRKNKRVSAAALAELERLLRRHNNNKEAFRLWHNMTTNEHPEPLKEVWNWLRIGLRSPEELFERLGKNKFVTILKAEDEEINRRGMRSKGTAEERHKGLNVIEMPDHIFESITINSKGTGISKS